MQKKDELTFYISPEGSDSWSGTYPDPAEEGDDGPFATLAAARDAVRDLKEAGEFRGPVTVSIRGGRYELKEPVLFTHKDSGPITYTAHPGEKPIFDGGQKLTGWHTEELSGKTVWVTDLKEVADGEWSFRQLFVNGERRPRARLPKDGFFWMEDVPDIDFSAGLFEGSDTFRVAPGDIDPDWRNLNDVEVVVLHYWIEERMPIATFDAETGLVESSVRSTFSLKDDWARRYAKYYVENVFEAMTEPGEWYLDRNTGRLYYIPQPEEKLESTVITAPRAEQFLRLEGEPESGHHIDYLTFRGLTFRHSACGDPRGSGKWFGHLEGKKLASAPQAAVNVPGAITFRGARHTGFEDCTVEHTGWYGIELSDGCRGNRIAGCEIVDTGAGGIKIDGADAQGAVVLRTGKNKVVDNHIHSGGRIFHSGVGVLMVHAFENRVAHNHIHDFYYTGISCGWVWGYAENVSRDNSIEKNHIHDLGHGLLSDMGGIYTLGVQPGTVLRGNLIHDVEKANYGGWAIYPDEGSSHILIENNICYNTSSQGFHQHYGRENIVRNNIFAFGREGQVAVTRAEEHNSLTFEKNIVLARGKPLYISAHLDQGIFKSDLNLFWDLEGGQLLSGKGTHSDEAEWELSEDVRYTLSQLTELGHDLHSKVADPRFKDPENGDFSLADDSPAFDLGFEAIDLFDVGPRN